THWRARRDDCRSHARRRRHRRRVHNSETDDWHQRLPTCRLSAFTECPRNGYTLICPRLLQRTTSTPCDTFRNCYCIAISAYLYIHRDEEFLGRRLRSERERRLITLESIAANTKISISLLRDLERDDVSRWPTGIFRRAFIRGYAQAIGLDADEIANEFLERHPDVEQLQTIASLVAKGERPKPRQQPVLRLTLADAPRPFSGGQFLKDLGARGKAAGWDCAATLTLGLIAYLVLGVFWTPIAVVTLCYYAGGILILGNSPGVCLFAPKPHDDTPQTPNAVEDASLEGLQTNAA